MKLIYRKAYNQYICVLICLLLMGSMAEGAVLCIGSDGHIDLEPASHEVCDDVYSPSAEHSQFAQKAEAQADNVHCLPCLDISVFAGDAAVYPPANKAKPKPLVATAFIRLAASGTEFSENELTLNLSAITNPYLTSIRSIILLV